MTGPLPCESSPEYEDVAAQVNAVMDEICPILERVSGAPERWDGLVLCKLLAHFISTTNDPQATVGQVADSIEVFLQREMARRLIREELN